MKNVNSLLGGLGTTIFTVMSALAVQHQSINLGQGFPDTDGPSDILEAAAAALFDGRNQYPPMPGVPELRHAVAAHDARFYGLDVNPMTEVVVTSGATEAIAATLRLGRSPTKRNTTRTSRSMSFFPLSTGTATSARVPLGGRSNSQNRP